MGREVQLNFTFSYLLTRLAPSPASLQPRERGSGTKRETTGTDLNKSCPPGSSPRAQHHDLLTPVLGVMARLCWRNRAARGLLRTAFSTWRDSSLGDFLLLPSTPNLTWELFLGACPPREPVADPFHSPVPSAFVMGPPSETTGTRVSNRDDPPGRRPPLQSGAPASERAGVQQTFPLPYGFKSLNRENINMNLVPKIRTIQKCLLGRRPPASNPSPTPAPCRECTALIIWSLSILRVFGGQYYTHVCGIYVCA